MQSTSNPIPNEAAILAHVLDLEGAGYSIRAGLQGKGYYIGFPEGMTVEGAYKRGDIVVIDQLVGEGPDFCRRTTVPSSHGWRSIVSYLTREEIVAYGVDGDTSGEYPFPHLMSLKGRESLASEMVAMAWAGPPLIDFAKFFSFQTDDDLESMRSRHGSLRSKIFIDELLRFKRWADALCIDPDDVLARAPRFRFNFREMRRDLVRTAHVIRAEERASELRHNWKLSPYQTQIEAVMMAWHRLNPATSMNGGIGVSIRAGALIPTRNNHDA